MLKIKYGDKVLKFPNNASANLVGTKIMVMSGTEILFMASSDEITSIIKDNDTIDIEE